MQNIVELFRDHTMEKFCRRLVQMGIEAEIAKGRRPPNGSKRLGGSWKYPTEVPIPFHPVGFINISKGPIRRISISRYMFPRGGGAESSYRIDYVVPDFRMTKEIPNIDLMAVYTRKGFLGIRVVDIHWDGNDFGLGVKDCLNRDEALKVQIMEASADDLQIELNINAKCWFITTESGYSASPPGDALWKCYQDIAQCLLGRADDTTLTSGATHRQWEWDETVD